ncbi:PREDICTED: traB domain-containing protein isoform X2 [Dinoponera quadriceps]|uniref:TraB domain-containing protein isoform X2 n=1 Tax=Dinoponera quadriceps TaxID=609295 RepID=A0A6P3Y054_DINQU|nr:PREDICTED: traB domain-containing protein isoform X2 [Dinoponera quadriceps]
MFCNINIVPDEKMASQSSEVDENTNDDQQQKILSAEDENYDIDERGDYIFFGPAHRVRTNSEPKAGSGSITECACTLTKDNYTKESIESFDKEIVTEIENEFRVDFGIQDKESQINDEVSEIPGIKEYDPTIDERLPETVTLLTTPDGGKLYLIGTAHFSVESQNDVSKIIQAVQPHIIVVELCKARVGILQLDEEAMFRYAKDISYQCIMDILKKEGLYNGLLHILLLRMAAHVAKELGMPPGGEFRRAFEEAKKIPNCMIHMADRPINITMQRALRALSWWQTIKLGWHLAFMKRPITQEDVEFCKQRSMLDEMIASMKGEFPVLGEVFIKERDIYLTYSLQIACMPQFTSHGIKPMRVVGIVGLGHTPGIIENWGKVQPTDISPILKVPPPSMSSKILKLTVKASVLGAAIYISYKVIAVPAALTFQSIKSSVEGLLKAISDLLGFLC